MTAVPGSSVSVVITTRDRPALLTRALRSVLGQTVPVSEIIVVDDASTSNTESVLRGFGDARINCLRHDTPRGAPAARNSGLRAVQGPFVAFLDDDDTWSPEKIAKQLTVFAGSDPAVAGIFTWSCKLSAEHPEWRQVARTPQMKLGFVDFLGKTFFGASVPLLRTECVRRIGGFDERLVSVQDRDMWLRLSRHHAFEGIPEVLVQHYVHGDQITTDLSRKITGKEQFLDKYFLELQRHPAILAVHCWRLGLMYCLDGDYETGQRRLREALDADPTNPAPADDLRWSERAPSEHARHLVERRFTRVGDFVLYY